MNCPKCGLINTGNMVVGLAMPQCMCQWQSTQEKSGVQTVPAQGGVLSTMKEGKDFTITLPPKQWVGLTDADKQIAFDDTQEASGGFWEFADAIEAKLKEKNT